MNSIRWLAVRAFGPLVGLIVLSSTAALAQDSEVAGIITELKLGAGVIEVRSAGSAEWRQAQPLLALRPGDAVRATEDASAVVVLSGGRGSVSVRSAESPLLVPATMIDRSKAQRTLMLLQASLNFLSASAKDAFRTVMVTRGAAPPVIVTPRNSRVLPDSLTFEWLGSNVNRYSVRILGSSNLILEQKGVVGSRFVYPTSAPRLIPGIRYTVQVLAERQPPEQAWFELLDSDQATVVRQDLLQMQEMLAPKTSPTSIAAVGAGFLLSQGLPHDARSSLLAALANDPGEPTLHLLLGNVYTSVGLPELASESYAAGQTLLARGRSLPAGQPQ